MKLTTLWIAAVLIAVPSILLAHAPKIGANRGLQTDAGSYHVEVLLRKTSLLVFLRDQSDQKVKFDGFKGIAIFIVGENSHRIQLTPDGDNRLSGIASVNLPPKPKGTVQIVTPSGSTVLGQV